MSTSSEPYPASGLPHAAPADQAVPRHPLVILTPAPTCNPSPLASKLLKEQCQRLSQSRDVYSVTLSCSPLENKNHFFSLSPYWWLTEDGKCERRDGQRNPAADLPQCQKQLETMAMTVHTLALGYKHLPSSDGDLQGDCLKRINELLRVFFVDDATRMLPEVEYSQCMPDKKPLEGNAGFIIATRYLILVAQALPLLPATMSSYPGVLSWFDAHITWLRAGAQGREASELHRKMSRWYHAALATYLLISNPSESVGHARKIMKEIISTHPDPANTLFPPDRLGTRPRHNTLFTLEPLCILASLTVPDLTAAYPARPEEEIISWLEEIVAFADQIQAGPMDVVESSDERRQVKIGFFKRILTRW